MISNAEIHKIAKQWNLEDHVIEKDYVLGWLLWGIAKHPDLSKYWILKGGAAIKKCYVDTHRYSQDLDFTVLPEGPWKPEELNDIFHNILLQVGKKSGINFEMQRPIFEIRPHGESCEGKIYYIGPRGNPSPTAAKLDITHAEDLMRPQILRSISHPYPDSFPDDVKLYCYSFEELFAEKIRAMGERNRPSDLYDIIYLFRRSDLNAEPQLILEVLEYKCEFKELPTPQISNIQKEEVFEENKMRWEPMLGRAVGHLPPIEYYWEELPVFFAWLNGEDYEIDLLPVGKDETWEPPSLKWQRGQSELLEPIRHAAVNRLLINLGYQNKFRLVEPYSLRRTQAGNILFYAIKSKVKQIRAYRIDRIQSVEVTNQPYIPVHRIEFTSEGRIPVPYTRRRRRFSLSFTSRRYVVECVVCGKRFYRKKYSTRINPHKQKGSQIQCYGRYGYLV